MPPCQWAADNSASMSCQGHLQDMLAYAGDSAAGVKTPQKTAWRSNTIAEEPEEEEDAANGGNRPQALSASACQQVQTYATPPNFQADLR